MSYEENIIETLPNEAQDLALHVALCEQRYRQLMNKVDHIEQKVDALVASTVELKTSIDNYQKETLKQYMTWGSIIIGILTSALGTMILKFLL